MARTLQASLVLILLLLLSACAKANRIAVVDETAIGDKNIHVIVTSDDVEDPVEVGAAIVEALQEHGISAEIRPHENASRQGGTGTGFVVADGYWVTNNHVVKGKDHNTVSLPGRDIPLTLVARNAEIDLAILKGDTSGLRPVKIGTAEIGEEVVVVGYPVPDVLTNAIRVTTGAVNSLDGWEKNHTRIQFSAPIQGGNSGGPVVGDNWELAGVVTSTLNSKGISTRINAIPQGMNLAVSPNDLEGYLLQNGIEQQGPYVSNLQELMASTGLMWNGEINKNKRTYIFSFSYDHIWDVFRWYVTFIRFELSDSASYDTVVRGASKCIGLSTSHSIGIIIDALLKKLELP